MTRIADLDAALAAQVAARSLSHAYIFSGEAAMEQALALTATLNCADYPQPPCRSCHACKSIAAGSYSDCRVIEPTDKNGNQNFVHRIETIRGICTRAELSAMEGRYKLFIIPQAELLAVEAANTLLKTLEEPADNTLFILLSEQPDALLPTVRSRCQQFRFGGAQKSSRLYSPDELEEAERFLNDLPQLALYQVLMLARKREKDRDGQYRVFLAMQELLYRAARREKSLPLDGEPLLQAAAALETAITMLNERSNLKLLTDVAYTRLWQAAGHQLP
ncbi:MAG: DNA polymerase III subunit [Bacillota bacterium]|nr:DNA polymerase III subunit [Bacillota bacterium]